MPAFVPPRSVELPHEKPSAVAVDATVMVFPVTPAVEAVSVTTLELLLAAVTPAWVLNTAARLAASVVVLTAALPDQYVKFGLVEVPSEPAVATVTVTPVTAPSKPAVMPVDPGVEAVSVMVGMV